MGNVPHAPESATLTVTIIPVTPVGGVKTPGYLAPLVLYLNPTLQGCNQVLKGVK